MSKPSKKLPFGFPAVGILLVLSMLVAAAAAQDVALECVDIAAAEERLACFDAAYATQEKSSSSVPEIAATASAGAVVSGPPIAVTTATEEEFGLPQSQAETLTSRITRVERGPTDRLTFYLENGQVWKQIESTYTPFRVRPDPAVAVITHGSLGSFKLTVEGGSRSVRVKRLE